MFEYLSFLRPPPESCPVNQGVTLVPQIANDLRTEPCEEEHNIFFAWQNESGGLSRGGFTKLTTWRPGATMYKPLTVALPAEAQAGEFWRLNLAVPGPDQMAPSLMLDLSQPEFGRLPFPVASLPIKVIAGEGTGTGATSRKSSSRQAAKSTSNRPSKSKLKPIEQSASTPPHQASKQEKIERFYLLPPSTTRPEIRSTLRITEQTSFDLDKKIWDSGVAVSSWLARLFAPGTESRPLTNSSPTLEANLIECFQKRLTQTSHSIPTNSLQVIELGTGTGLVSIILAGLFAQCTRIVSQLENTASIRRARILATDLSSAVELIKHNQTINEHLWITTHDQDTDQPRCPCQIELHGMDLDWDNPISPKVWEPEGNTEPEHAALPFDIIIMADVTYNTASFSSLLDTVTALLAGPSSSASTSAPMILLAYKCRDLAERTLWSDASARGISFVQVDKVKGATEPAVEIWLGGWERDVNSMWRGT